MKQLTLETINSLYAELSEGRTPPVFLMHIFRGEDNAPIDTLQYAVPLPPWLAGVFGPTQMHFEVRFVNNCVRICFHHEHGLPKEARDVIENYIKNNTFLAKLKHNEQGSWQGYETGEIIWKDIPANEANAKLIVQELCALTRQFSGFLFMQLERVLSKTFAAKRSKFGCFF